MPTGVREDLQISQVDQIGELDWIIEQMPPPVEAAHNQFCLTLDLLKKWA